MPLSPRQHQFVTFLKEWGWVGAGTGAILAFAIALFSAYFTWQGLQLQGQGLAYTKKTYELEARPELALSCSNDLLRGWQKESPFSTGTHPPRRMFFVTTDFARPTNYLGEQVFPDMRLGRTTYIRYIYVPNSYERCTLTNTGRTAAVGVTLHLTPHYIPDLSGTPPLPVYFGDLDGGGAHVQFGLVNGEPQAAFITFKQFAETTDTGLDAGPHRGPCQEPITAANEDGHCRPLTISPPVPIEIISGDVFLMTDTTHAQFTALDKFLRGHKLTMDCIASPTCKIPGY
jgi:hypothetical protein